LPPYYIVMGYMGYALILCVGIKVYAHAQYAKVKKM